MREEKEKEKEEEEDKGKWRRTAILCASGSPSCSS